MAVKKNVKKPRVPCVGRFAVVAARFNSGITDSLLKACLAELARLGVPPADIEVVRVPGAFEVPVTALALAQREDVDAVICLGAVIRGQTLHYELVAGETARGIMAVALMTWKPVIFEILAADTIQLCAARAKSGDRDNKGASAARAAVEMVDTLKGIRAHA
jgi:6,7-dimethyl-8-ribityllumazine synthase